MTLGALLEIWRRQIPVPQRLAIISFDDLDCAELLTPPLTAVLQQPYMIGYQAAKLLFHRLMDKNDTPMQEIRIPTVLQIRGSV
jgi:LacI family transcriptional regulator